MTTTKTTKVRFRQIGNGGAFDYKMTNSSFLIETKNTGPQLYSNPDSGKEETEYLLFDCGHSVFAKLRELDDSGQFDITKLKHVFVSHMDDDHIGSLKTLIYYMFFVKGQKLNVIFGNGIMMELQNYLSDIDGYNDNFEKVKATLFTKQLQRNKDVFTLSGVVYRIFEVDHCKPAYGLQVVGSNHIYYEKDAVSLLISGDTRPSKNIAEIVEKNISSMIIFHDYSAWDCPEKQVHSCDTSLNKIYSKKLVDSLNHYHDGKSYYSGWVELNQSAVSTYSIYTSLARERDLALAMEPQK